MRRIVAFGNADLTEPYDLHPCSYGNCTVEVSRLTGKILGSYGPVSCPCDLTPGWKAERLEQMGKPHVPAKAAGRHKGRIERSRRRHQLPEWVGAELHQAIYDEVAYMDAQQEGSTADG